MGGHDIIERLNLIRDAIEHARAEVIRLCEPSRETSLALTKLDEARLWGQEAVAAPVSSAHVKP